MKPCDPLVVKDNFVKKTVCHAALIDTDTSSVYFFPVLPKCQATKNSDDSRFWWSCWCYWKYTKQDVTFRSQQIMKNIFDIWRFFLLVSLSVAVVTQGYPYTNKTLKDCKTGKIPLNNSNIPFPIFLLYDMLVTYLIKFEWKWQTWNKRNNRQNKLTKSIIFLTQSCQAESIIILPKCIFRMDKNSCEPLGKFEYSAEVRKMILRGNVPVYSNRLGAVILAFYSKMAHSIFLIFMQELRSRG